MISLIISLLIVSQPPLSGGDEILSQMAHRYSIANGIQWTMQSQTHSRIFEETSTTPVQFYFNPPDTFYYASDNEQVIGVADTIWILSKQHKQIQKKLNDSYLLPTDFIISWNQRYTLKSYITKGELKVFELVGKEDVTPINVRLTLGKTNRIKSIFYKDISGDDVTLTVTKEKLKRFLKIDLFYLHIPKGYKLVELTE